MTKQISLIYLKRMINDNNDVKKLVNINNNDYTKKLVQMHNMSIEDAEILSLYAFISTLNILR